MTTSKIHTAALRIILKSHKQYASADTEGRKLIKRNVGSDLAAIQQDGHTVETLIEDYKAAR